MFSCRAAAPGTWTRSWKSAVLGVSLSTVACYSTRVLETAPQPGTTVVLDLNDRARVALGDRIGPSAARVTGLVDTSPTDTAYLVRISSVRYLNGQTNQWAGEPVPFSKNYISQVSLQQHSRGRTIALGVGIAAALALVISRTSLLGSATDGSRPDPGGGTGTSLRIPARVSPLTIH